MATPRTDSSREPSSAASDEDNLVDRSLDDFIARVSTTPVRRVAVGSSSLVVLGSQSPLAEVTEIVSRMPARAAAPGSARRFLGLRVGAAFVAGGLVVLALSRLFSSAPPPAHVAPVTTAIVVPVVTPVVTPAPTVERLPVPPEAVAPAPTVVKTAPRPPRARAPALARAEDDAAPARPVKKVEAQKARDSAVLVDPFSGPFAE